MDKLRSRSNDINEGHASQLETISSSPANVTPKQKETTTTCTGRKSKKGLEDGIRPSKTLSAAGLKAKKRSGPVIHAVEIKKAKMSRGSISYKASVQKGKSTTKKNLPKIKRSKMSCDSISNKASVHKGKNSTKKNLPKKYTTVKKAPLREVVCKKTSRKMPPQRNGSPPKGKAKAVQSKQTMGNKQKKSAASSSLKKKSVKIKNNVKSVYAIKKVKCHKKKMAPKLPAKKVAPSKKAQTVSHQGKERIGHKGCPSEVSPGWRLGKAQSHCTREVTNGRKRSTQEQEVRETTPCSRKGKDRQSVFTELPLPGKRSQETPTNDIGAVPPSGRSGNVSQTDAIDAAVPASRTRSKTQTGAVGRGPVSPEMCNGSLMNTTEMAPAVRTRNQVLEDRMTDAPPRKIPRKGLQILEPTRIKSRQGGEAVAPPSVRDSSTQPDVIMRVEPFNRTRSDIQRAARQEVSSARKGSVSAREDSVVKAGDLATDIQSALPRKESVSAREDSVFKVPCDLQRGDLGGDTSIQPCGLKGDGMNTDIQSTSSRKDFANSGEESAVKKPCDLQRGDLSTGIQSDSVLQQVEQTNAKNNDIELPVLDEDVNSQPVAMEEDDDDKEESVRCGPKEEKSDSTLQEPSAASGGESNPPPPHPPTPSPELQDDKRKECSGPSKDDPSGPPLTHVDGHTDDQEDCVVSTSETQRLEQMRQKDADNQRGGQLMEGSDNQRESADNHDKAPVRRKNVDNYQQGTDIQNEGRLIEDTDNHHQKDADAHTVMPLKKNGTDNQREGQLRGDTDNHQRGDRHAQTQKQLKRNSTDNQRQGQLRKEGADKPRETEDANDEKSESRRQLKKNGADNQRQGQLRKEGADKPRETEDANDEKSESRTQLKKNGADNQRQGQLRKVAVKRRETKDTDDEVSESMAQLRREEELREEEAEARRELEKIRELIRRHKEEETMMAAIKLATKDQSPEKGKPGEGRHLSSDGKEGKKNVPYASRTQEDTMDDDETDSNYEDDLTSPGHVAESKDEDGNGGDPPEGATSTCLQGDNRKEHGRRLRDRKSLQLVIEKLVDRTNSIGPVDSQPPIGDGHSIAEYEDRDPGSAAFESQLWVSSNLSQ